VVGWTLIGKGSDGICLGSGEANDLVSVSAAVSCIVFNALGIHSIDNQDVLSVARFSLSTRRRAR